MKTHFIVISGVTRGLGRALVVEFGGRGLRMAGCGRHAETIAEMNRQMPEQPGFTALDIADRARVVGWAEDLTERHGPPDLLINNAGILNRDAPFVELPSGDFDRMLDVNVKGTANVIRAFLPAMLEKRSGVVVNFSSGAGVRGYADLSAYCTCKFAIEGLSKSLACEVPPTMAIIALQPGVIDTDMLRGHFGDRAGDYEEPGTWARRAAPFILGLGPEHNGKSLRIEAVA